MLRGSAGQLLLQAELPHEMRESLPVLDKKGLAGLLQDLGHKHPEKYRQVLHAISKLAHQASYFTGGHSFGPEHLLTTRSGDQLKAELEREVDRVWADGKLSQKEKEQRVLAVTSSYQDRLEKAVYDESLAEKNPLAYQVLSGSRGNKTNLRSLRGADLLYVDHHDNPIPVPVLHSYSQGLRPHEYFASSFGARKGVIDTKLSVGDTGFMSKQLVQATHRLLVTAHDAEHPSDTVRGLPVETSDPDNEGAALAHDVGGYKRNTLLNPRILADLSQRGHKHILVRSPTVGGSPEGGVYGLDVGVREKGRVAPPGDFVGIAAAQALGEGLTQGALCLARGTLVRMADWSVRAIEAIVPGDRVLGAARDGKAFPVTVLRCFTNGMRNCVSTRFSVALTEEQVELVSTRDHKVLATVRYRDPKTELAIPGIYPVSEKCVRLYACMVRAVAVEGGEEDNYALLLDLQPVGLLPTYDIEVDHPDHLFVLANGLIVSNSSKHSGGVAGATARTVGGFDLVNQLVQTPQVFKGGATHAQLDGRVQSVEAAPQGGHYVRVNDQRHHVAQGHKVTVAPGEDVEAGDVLSEGIPNPGEVVRHKGVGEGRRYFTEQFRQAYRDMNAPAHRRNIELVARGLIDHVRLTDEYGRWVPDDVVKYSALEHDWQPREGHQVLEPRRALGMYLEKPVLHYSIGTRIKPSVVRNLQAFGVGQVHAHQQPPPFEPEMVRGLESLSADPDWMTRFLGSYVKKNLLRGAHRGDVADERGTSYVPSLVRAVDFDRFPPVKGWQPVTGDSSRPAGMPVDDTHR